MRYAPIPEILPANMTVFEAMQYAAARGLALYTNGKRVVLLPMSLPGFTRISVMPKVAA